MDWKQNLEYLYNQYQAEKQEFEKFLTKHGYILGTYIQDIFKIVQKYQKSRGINHQEGDRLFGDSYRDFLLKNIIEENIEEIKNDKTLKKQVLSLLNISKTHPESNKYFVNTIQKV